jgi:predicted Zn-dependent peptidase
METDGSAAATPQELLGMQLEQNDALQLGSLENGLRWVILPNRSPPARFEAHLEVHAGSGAQWPPLLAPSLLLAACLAV